MCWQTGIHMADMRRGGSSGQVRERQEGECHLPRLVGNIEAGGTRKDGNEYLKLNTAASTNNS